MSNTHTSGNEGTRRGATAMAPAVGAVIAGAIVLALAVGVGGDFPLSDDWSYAYTTRELCRTGLLRFLPWTGASLVLQATYGALLCRIAGFSFVTLRVSTLLLALSGALAFLFLLRRVGVRGAALALATSIFALSPLYVNLAFTFMTDVPFTVAAIWAAYCYFRGLEEDRPSFLLAGSLLAAAALLIRQHGILVAGAASLAALFSPERPLAGRVTRALFAGTVPALVLIGYLAWLFAIHGAPPAVATKIAETRATHLTGLVNCAFRSLEHLGLLLLPLAAALRIRLQILRPRLVRAYWALLTLPVLVLWLREGALMPYLTNVVYDFGLGALSLRDTLFLGLRPPLQIGPALTVPLTVLATIGSGLLLTAWTGSLPSRRDPARLFLALAFGLLFAGTLLHARYYFDRYLLVVLPFAIAATLAIHPLRFTTPGAMVLAALLAWYTVAGTHDYLAWNRARYAGLDALAVTGVPPSAIDGGVEFNAWHLAAELGTWPTAEEARPGKPETERSWWWVVDDRFVASFRPLPRYRVWRELPYTRWLVPGVGRVVILERVDESGD